MSDDDLYQGSVSSKLVGKVGAFSLPIAAILACSGEWSAAILVFLAGVGITYVAYRLAGGRSNPEVHRDALVELPPGPQTARERIAVCIVRLGLVMSAADGRVTPEEVGAIREFFIKRGAGGAFLRWIDDQIAAACKYHDKERIFAEINRTCDGTQKEVILLALMSIAMADGKIHEREVAVFFYVAAEMGFSEERTIAFIREVTGHGPGDEVTGKAAEREQALAVLGVSKDATPDQIKSAYRKLAAQYHPDKVSHLGPEFSKLAEEKMTRINKAYQALSA